VEIGRQGERRACLLRTLERQKKPKGGMKEKRGQSGKEQARARGDWHGEWM
jgi:hypothetical protein